MVTGLQLALKEFSPDGSVAKSHPRDSKTIQGLTFGGILRDKEKQLRDAQTVSAASIAAAVAAMQALPIVQSVVVANVSQFLTETQPVDAEASSATEVEAPETLLHQPQQANSTIFAAGLSQNTSQTLINTGTPASVVATGTGIDTGKDTPPSLSRTDELLEMPVQFGIETPPVTAAIEPEKIDGRFGKTSPADEIPQYVADAEAPSAEAQVTQPVFKPAAGTGAGQETRAVSADIPSAQFETGQEGVFLEPKMVRKQANANSRPAEVPQAPIELPAIISVSSDLNVGSETKRGIAKTSVKMEVTGSTSIQDLPQIPKESAPLSLQDLPEIVLGQAAIVAEKSDVDVKHTNEHAASVMEGLQSATDSIEVKGAAAEKISEDTGIASESRQATQPVARAEALTVASVRPAQGMQSVPVESSHELPAVETEGVETQSKLNVPAEGTPRATASVIEKAQGVQAVEVRPKPDDQSPISANDAGKFEHAQANSESKADATGKLTAPAQSARQEAAQAVVTRDEIAKAQFRQAAVKSALTEPANSKIHPAEEQQGTNPGIETVAAQAPQARENQVETVAGTGSGMEAKIRTAEVVQQIVHHVEARIHNRSTAMHLQLNPKELGVIDVQMVSGPQGVSVTFSAEQPATGRLLETQLSQLHQALTDAGVQISGLNIGQHGQPRQEGGFLNQNSQFAQPTQQDASRKEADIQEPRRPVRVTGASGEVDYLI
jgi:hypothetical protein